MAVPAITILDGNGAAKALGALQDANNNFIQSGTTDNGQATFRASIMYTLGVATPTAVIVMQGNAGKTIRFSKIALGGWATTEGCMKFKLSRRSTAGTLGSAALTAIPTQGKNDTASGASSLTISTVGTANYGTLGTLTSILDCGVVQFPKAATTGSGSAQPLNFAMPGQHLLLRGASDWLTIDGGADAGGDAVPAGGILLATIEWVEDGS